MKDYLKFLMHERGKAFVRGSFGGAVSGFVFMFNANLNWNNIAILWAVKFLGIIILSFTGGLMNVLAIDFYNHKIKSRFFKNKKDERPKDDERVA